MGGVRCRRERVSNRRPTRHDGKAHRIRHATATLLVNNGMPLEEVSRYLGHSSTDVTRRYAQQTSSRSGIAPPRR